MSLPAGAPHGDDPTGAPSDAADTVERLSGFYGEVVDTWSTDALDQRRPHRRRRRQRGAGRHRRDRTPSQASGRTEQGGGPPSRIVHLVDGDFTDLWETAADLASDAQADGVDRSIAVAALIAHAVCGALRRFPTLHATYDPDAGGRRLFETIDLGITVATTRGATVATIKDAHTRSIQQLATDTAGIVAKCRRGTLASTDPAGSTFTVDAADLSGHDDRGLVVSAPQVGLLHVGSIREGLWVHEGELARRRVARLRLVHDGRVCDHDQARRFIEHASRLCENPAA